MALAQFVQDDDVHRCATSSGMGARSNGGNDKQEHGTLGALGQTWGERGQCCGAWVNNRGTSTMQ
eukprot:CAMPEP_0174366806 /NCGR_PEP_ID=MMETSP0811_2-20130205/82658_1 /TAXON_ID=73025 ORGANISM="Eutreptiella gymnastica-like, Strain CCMP1594" /NCGR_SAMPLE_ID=MMETSP0811_2 /ASSEMBLY_ACC=CAM_ASM_000667 /LENGTH=64 /DNA_ID=CAMNT_0015508729 /DNA_START=198 /DNA_END=389 /DNA_ORIENTATION=+